MTTAPADSAPAVSATAIAAGPPDWEHLEREVLCPLCLYNLRGLMEPLCPECGYRFAWQNLLDPDASLHPYLFEHHPERNVSSFFDTLLGGMRPKRFWSALKPQQPSSPRRLRDYAVACAMAMLVGTAGVALTAEPGGRAVRTTLWRASREFLPEACARVVGVGIGWWEWLDKGDFYRCALPLALVAWPWVTLAALLLFAQSMGRAKVRKVHVLRCVAYSGDVIVAAGVAGVCFAATEEVFSDWATMTASAAQAWVLLGGAAAVWLVASWRLFRAYQLYLRFHRPLLTVLASQVIVLLAGLAVVTMIWEK